MKFGGLIFKKWTTPEEWAQAALEAGYSAVYFPVDHTAPTRVIDGFVNAAKAADLTICEIGVWNNLLDPDPQKRAANLSRAIHQLELAEYVRAGCCVNIAGTHNPTVWDGPHPDSFTRATFDEVVETTRRIIDAVRPQHTCYTLEPMPWMLPDSADSCLELIRAVDREAFAAHLDIVNIINTPRKYYDTGAVIREWFDKLGPWIRSCHVKDITLRNDLTVHLEECRPGTGHLDLAAYLTCASRLDDKLCLMLEHMTEESDYIEATRHIKGLAASLGLRL